MRYRSTKHIQVRSGVAKTLAINLGFVFCCTACAQLLPADKNRYANISVIGTNDFHGAIFKSRRSDGISIFAGYMGNLRRARARDGGAVVLLDAGDMWQGSMESNSLEGAPVVIAYQDLGYTAVTIGNHEFDFGPVGPRSVADLSGDNPVGALVARTGAAKFPFLSANIVDKETQVFIDWPNVQPSIMIAAAGAKIGIIGAVTEYALSTTIEANVKHLDILPLRQTIQAEALALRKQGADIVIVAAHAGGSCASFESADDLSSCNLEGEIFRLAQSLQPNLVDVIVAGHIHEGIAHSVNGIAIIASYAFGKAFGRVDLKYDLQESAIAFVTIHKPQMICEFDLTDEGQCEPGDAGAARATYEGETVWRDMQLEAKLTAISADALEVKNRKLDVFLEDDVDLSEDPDSPLGNLVTDILLHAAPEADAALLNTVGGLRSNLPRGQLVYGSIFEMYPFDNRLTTIELSGADLKEIFQRQLSGRSRRDTNVSGLSVIATCVDGEKDISILKETSERMPESESITVATTDFLATGGGDILGAGADLHREAGVLEGPKLRDLIERWFMENPGKMTRKKIVELNTNRIKVSESARNGCRNGGAKISHLH